MERGEHPSAFTVRQSRDTEAKLTASRRFIVSRALLAPPLCANGRVLPLEELMLGRSWGKYAVDMLKRHCSSPYTIRHRRDPAHTEDDVAAAFTAKGP